MNVPCLTEKQQQQHKNNVASKQDNTVQIWQ